MQATRGFGKRKAAERYPAWVPTPVLEPEDENPVEVSSPVGRMRLPYLTFAIIAVLTVIFCAEQSYSFEPPKNYAPGLHSLVALGGLSADLMFRSGEWWRFFTAPLLHGDLVHLVSNCVALLFAGLVLERMIGSLWFGALFVISALGGAIGSLVHNPPSTVTVGASGAIMGMLATAFVCSFIFESVQLRVRMQKISLRLLLPSLVPALLPLAAMHVDYGAHIGGAIAGAAMGFVLREFWPDESPRPMLRKLASGIVAAGTVLPIWAFVLVSQHYPAYAARHVPLIPEAELLPLPDAIARSQNLVDRFPHDPRGYLYRGFYFLERNNIGDAERALRTGLEEKDVLTTDLPHEVELALDLLLAAVLVAQGRTPEAKILAAPACGLPDLQSKKIIEMLKDKGVCS